MLLLYLSEFCCFVSVRVCFLMLLVVSDLADWMPHARLNAARLVADTPEIQGTRKIDDFHQTFVKHM